MKSFAMRALSKTFLMTPWLLAAAHAEVGALPESIVKQIPAGYAVLSTARGLLDSDAQEDFLVAIGRRDEAALSRRTRAPARALLLFVQNPGGGYTLVRRNDHVILKIDEGGQCDPFEDGIDGLVIKNRYFTIQNAVACGQHWEYFVTFKYERDLQDWVFHKRTVESWALGDGGLEPQGRSVESSKGKAKILFSDYRNP